MKDIRQEVLDRLGMPFSDPLDPNEPEDSLDNRWENAEGESRDRMLARVENERWRTNTDDDDVLDPLYTFPENSRRLIALLFAESVGHLSDDPRVAECRRVTLEFCHGRATREQMDDARDAMGEMNFEEAELGDAEYVNGTHYYFNASRNVLNALRAEYGPSMDGEYLLEESFIVIDGETVDEEDLDSPSEKRRRVRHQVRDSAAAAAWDINDENQVDDDERRWRARASLTFALMSAAAAESNFKDLEGMQLNVNFNANSQGIFDASFGSPVVADEVRQEATRNSSGEKSFSVAVGELIDPDGPLKLLVETISCGDFAVLASQWDAGVKHARELFSKEHTDEDRARLQRAVENRQREFQSRPIGKLKTRKSR